MDDDLKAAFTADEAIAELRRRYPQAFDGTDPVSRHDGLRLENARDWVLAVVLASALRQRDEALESLRAERDLYRLVAVNQGWNWRLCDAYGRDEYQKQREKHVDDCVAVAQSHAARAILTGSKTNAR